MNNGPRQKLLTLDMILYRNFDVWHNVKINDHNKLYIKEKYLQFKSNLKLILIGGQESNSYYLFLPENHDFLFMRSLTFAFNQNLIKNHT